MSTADERTKRLAQLSPAKQALLEKWAQGEAQNLPSRTIPRRMEGETIFPSFVQEWNARYPDNETSAILVNEPLEVDVLVRSFNELICRHETLHTAYPIVDGKLAPTVIPPMSIDLPIEDLQALPVSERMDKAMSIAREEIHRRLHFETGQVFHIRLFRLSSEHYLLIVVLSKIIVDIWSQLLLFRELREIYEAFVDGLPSTLPEPLIQYADFTTWQRRSLQGDAWDTFLGYWKQQLADAPRLVTPTDISLSAGAPFEEDQLRLTVPEQLIQQLRAFNRAENCTMFMTLFAVFQLLMYAFTGQHDLVIGIDLSSRTLPETEQIMGVFTHQLPVRQRLVDHQSFREVLEQLRGIILDVYAHQGVPLGLLMEILSDPGQLLRANQFLTAAATSVNENMLLTSLKEDTLLSSPKKPKLSMVAQTLVDDADQEELSLQIRDTTKSLTIDLVYHVRLYSRSTIVWFMDSYHKLLMGIVANPNQSIAELLQTLESREQER